MLGPFTPGQSLSFHITREDEDFILAITEADPGGGAFTPDDFVTPTWPEHWVGEEPDLYRRSYNFFGFHCFADGRT